MLTMHGPRSVAVASVAALSCVGIQCARAESDIFATLRDAGTIISGSPILDLTVPPGKYAIFAKINLDQDDPKSTVTVDCSLQIAGVVRDRNVIRLQRSADKYLDNAAIPFQLAVDCAFDCQISLTCKFIKSESNKVSFRFAKMTAIRIDGSFCEKPSPAVCFEAWD